MHTRAAWVIVVLTACLAWSAPAGAAQVSGSLQVTGVTATTLSFTVTAQRTCAADEQCDYYADLEELDGDGPCPTDYPSDPWNAWNGDVLNTGPSTETGTITPRRWPSTAAVAPSRLCLFIYADHVYYYVDGTTITRPSTPAGGGTPTTPGAPGSSLPGVPKPKAPGSSGSSSPTPPGAATTKLTCAHYVYQQNAQKALDADRSLAARLDPNHDGVACQGLPKRKTYVRTLGTAASATSARAALRHAYGQAFAQRTGFRSRCARRSRIRVRCAVSWQHEGTWTGYVDVVGAIRANRQAILTHVHVRRP
ncbi:hypothetical protein DSM104299_00139 [Baekduia alba]|uniref:hypothetical protein n=1 Tax=Baekduia alba TaxID=2997333 RepID=UPI0023416D89|nr:hypothetical protein [Baekduia alba]WCB91468.1 hypothetical protein DSM104299_00139 [Baekduia alba]